jgi:hypothetical protein
MSTERHWHVYVWIWQSYSGGAIPVWKIPHRMKVCKRLQYHCDVSVQVIYKTKWSLLRKMHGKTARIALTTVLKDMSHMLTYVSICAYSFPINA